MKKGNAVGSRFEWKLKIDPVSTDSKDEIVVFKRTMMIRHLLLQKSKDMGFTHPTSGSKMKT